jgi:hypothetical protein
MISDLPGEIIGALLQPFSFGSSSSSAGTGQDAAEGAEVVRAGLQGAIGPQLSLHRPPIRRAGTTRPRDRERR